MSKVNTPTSELIQNLQNATFNEVFFVVRNKNFFTKDKRKKNTELFWQSDLPIKWNKEFLNSDYSEDFLFAYFSKNEHCNTAFVNSILTSKHKNTVVKIIKLTNAFELENHWASFLVFKTDSDLKIIYKELEFIRDFRTKWEQESKGYEQLISQFSYEDILIQTTAYFERFKQLSPKTLGNFSDLTGYEFGVISVLNTILNIKKSIKGSENNTYSVDEFRERVIKKQENIGSIINFYFAKKLNEYYIQNYLAGFVDFKMIEKDDYSAELYTNDLFINYRRSLEKPVLDEYFFMNKVYPSTKNDRLKSNLESSISYLSELKIPLIIEFNKTKIDLKKVIHLLQVLSEDVKPIERFYNFNYINCFDKDEFIHKCCDYFNWDYETVNNILNYLLSDFDSNRKFKLSIIDRPLIQVGGKIIWISTFNRKRRWEIILHKRIATERDKQSNLKTQVPDTEKYVAELFRNAGFGAVSSHCYKYDGKEGEIDTLAYKDNTLFIVELKSTYVEEDVLKTSKYETKKFNSLASQQLDRAIQYVKANFNEIKNINELNIDCSLGDLKFQTLIVSNIYQADNLIFKEKHLKTSLFELMIILNNDLYNMSIVKSEIGELPVDFYENMMNSHNPNYKKNDSPISKESCNLWRDIKDCKPTDVINCIKNETIWERRNQSRLIRSGEMKLELFNHKKKYLI